MVERLFPNTNIHTVNICQDEERNSPFLHNSELNTNVNHCRFIGVMENKEWNIDEIYIDYYRMSNVYISTNFSNGFFTNLKNLPSSTVFEQRIDQPSRLPIVFLPFSPHMFVNVH